MLSMSSVERVRQTMDERLLGANARSVFAGDVVHLDAALPDSPDLAYGSGRMGYQNVTLDELGRISGSKLGWAPPGGKFPIGAVGGGVDAALPDLPDLVTRLCRVRHQNVTFDELGRNSVSQWGWAPPGGKLPDRSLLATVSTVTPRSQIYLTCPTDLVE
jgi:hypothetical protein